MKTEECPLYSSDITLNEESHTYKLKSNSEVEFRSATEFIGSFFEDVDFEEVAEDLTTSHPKYAHLTKDELLGRWQNRTDRGTDVHNDVEDYVAGEIGYSDIDDPKSLQGLAWVDKFINPDKHWAYPEVILFSKQLQISGTPDLLIYHKDKDKYIIADWKTNKKIPQSAYGGKTGIRNPTRNIEDCKFNKYELQMSLYRWLMENVYGVNVDRQILVHLREDDYQYYFPEYRKNVIENMFKYENLNL